MKAYTRGYASGWSDCYEACSKAVREEFDRVSAETKTERVQ